MKARYLIILCLLAAMSLNAQVVIDGEGDINVGTSTGAVSKMEFGPNQWLKFKSSASSTSGLLFYETQGNLSNNVQYGAKIYYNESADRLNISTMQDYTENYSITLQRTYGRVGILNVSPSYQLDVNGYVRATNISVSSDMRLKKDIRALDTSAVSLIKNLSAIEYRPVFKYPLAGMDGMVTDTLDVNYEKERKRLDKTMIGFSAQTVRQYLPSLVSEDDQGYLSVDYLSMVPILLEALKASDKELQAQKEKIAALEKRLEAMEVRR